MASFQVMGGFETVLLLKLQTALAQLSYADIGIIFSFLFTATRLLRQEKSNPIWFERPQQNEQCDAPPDTRDIGQNLRDYHLVVFWGSQSGTAEGFAHRLAGELHSRFRLKALVAGLDDYDHHTLVSIPETKLVLFIMSTYGEGEPSDNAMQFHKWLSSTRDSLKFQYAAFGLGNSNYRLYNAVINDVVKALDNRGAIAFIPVGRADDATRSTDEDYVEWKEQLLSKMAADMQLQEYEPKYEPKYVIKEATSISGDPRQPLAKGALVSVPAVIRRDLVPQSRERQCVHLDFDMTAHPEVKYRTGDHVLIWPQNPEAEVQQLLTMLRLRPEQPLSITPTNHEDCDLPSSATAYALFKSHLDICAPITRQLLLTLAQFAPTCDVKSTILDIARDRCALQSLTTTRHLNFSRLLAYLLTSDPKADWFSLPLEAILSMLSTIRPRPYSISSSAAVSPRKPSITISVKPTPLAATLDVTIPGLASTYLSTVPLPNHIRVQIRRSEFKLPFSSTTPIIMVAAGTGIAPFRGFLAERARLQRMGRDVGKMVLFFGCQDPADQLYADDIHMFKEQLHNTLEVVTAYSRVPGQEKKYVQDAIRERAEEVLEMMMEQDAAFYVCGSTKMARGVRDVVEARLQLSHGWDAGRIDEWRAERKRAKRWMEDVWG